MLYRLQVEEEIAIVVGGAEHATLRYDIGALAPLFWLDITAMVVGISRLESKKMTIANFGFNIHTRNTSTAGIGTGEKQVAHRIMSVLNKGKDIIELGKGVPVIDEKEKTEENLIKGCQSRVWLSCRVEDGKLYMLAPLPEGVSKEEVDRAVQAGIIKLYDGMMTDDPKACEERDGELWLEVGEGMSDDGWAKISDDDGYLFFMTTRYVKAK